ncbi:DNA-binding helix-turn-helix protein [Leptospira interrogans serovar Medanensis str. L0448]|uniref:helix-turn-helix domain-containing protein n=1 Tax=Leptospira interrogans TaxID=173 RepID=UPI0002980155|nr:helix-turn-helix domain-containing protein [Leptospira interrogans]EKR82610.1 DNA-binding helix-turn-helix protein [Leptospira interrogans str. UI 08452]EMN33171.1 DNA-binding helix-turn-helix protein [Leptospira interrogans serovar Medanensis str. L0448]EMN38304.1 DNA-binding helix-turn-helix protein [Leptospira interrogans str. L0996]
MEENYVGEFIPRAVINTKLSRGLRDLLAKITLLDIAGRCEGRNGCYAGNEYLATCLGMAATTIAKYISRLRKAGYIEQVSFDGRVRVIRSTLHDAVVMERVQYKISKTALANNPSQPRTNGQDRGIQQGRAAWDNRSVAVRTKEESKKTLNVSAEKIKSEPTWNGFLDWAEERLTRSSNDVLKNLKIDFKVSELRLLEPVTNSLSMIILKYFTEEVKRPISVKFVEKTEQGRAA